MIGYTNELGRVERNQALSRRRADAVKMWMVAHGVSATAIRTEIRTASLGVEDIEGSRDPQNRRVEISFEQVQ